MAVKTYQDAKDRYLKEKVDTFVLRVPKGQKDIIKKHANLHNMSLNAYIVELIKRDIDGFISETVKTKPVSHRLSEEKISDDKNQANNKNAENQQKKKSLPSWLM